METLNAEVLNIEELKGTSEFIVQPIEVPEINTNLEDVEIWVKGLADSISKQVVTIDNLEINQETSRKASKLIKQLNDSRLEVKRTYDKPIKELKEQVDKILEPLEKAKANIDSQIEVFVLEQQEEKRVKVNELLSDVFKDYDLLDKFKLKFEFDERWIKNKSMTNTTIIKEATEQLEKLKQENNTYVSNVEVIKQLVDKKNEDLDIKLEANNYLSLFEKDVYTIVELMNLIEEDFKRNNNQSEALKNKVIEEQKAKSNLEIEKLRQEQPVVELVEDNKDDVKDSIEYLNKTLENDNLEYPQALYNVNFQGTIKEVTEIIDFLKENGYNYTIKNKALKMNENSNWEVK